MPDEEHPTPPAADGGGKSALVPEGAKKKIGPLPLWAWAVVAAGVIGAVIIVRRGKSASSVGTAAPVDPLTTTTPTDTGAVASSQTPNPLTESALLAALQKLSTDIENARPAQPVMQYLGNSGAQGPSLGPGLNSQSGLNNVGTSHTTGGSSIGRLANAPPVFQRARSGAAAVVGRLVPTPSVFDRLTSGGQTIAQRTFESGQATQAMVAPPNTLSSRTLQGAKQVSAI